MSTATITLTKGALQPEQLAWLKSQALKVYPLRVSATSNINFEANSDLPEADSYPANIFVLQLSGTGLDPNQGDIFKKIIKLPDLYDLPTADNLSNMNTANAVYQTPYYRVDSVELVCETPEEADMTWEAIQADVSTFLSAYNSMDNITDAETVVIG